jgi:hypothetical protein
MTTPAQLIDQIIALELTMLQTVPVRQRSFCQEEPQRFSLYRRAQFVSWSLRTLSSYLEDLLVAQKADVNLLTLKYAQMENLLPRRNDTQLVEPLVDAMCQWQGEFMARYPHFMAQGRPLREGDTNSGETSFETHLRGELESYSTATLESLWRDVQCLQQQGKSMSEQTYAYLVQQWGLDSVDHLEAFMERHPGVHPAPKSAEKSPPSETVSCA